MLTEKCRSCGVNRPLSDFRRWLGAKKIRSTVCCVCHPRKTPRTMSPRQRINEAAHGRQHLLVMQVMNDVRRTDLRRRLSEAVTRVQAKRRRQAWHHEVRRRLLNQQRWAERMLTESDASLVAFAREYREVLIYILGQTQKLAGRTAKGTPVYPTEREKNPRTYLTEAQYARLVDVYSQAGAAFVRRRFKEPDFLGWPQPDAIRKPGRPKGKPRKKTAEAQREEAPKLY